jgi:hypothetical protein
MALRNWLRFRPPRNKRTTIRDHALTPGEHKTLAGSYYHSVRLGVLEIGDVLDDSLGAIKRVKYLDDEDARNDGFKDQPELLEEISEINPDWTPETIAFIHPARVVEDLIP